MTRRNMLDWQRDLYDPQTTVEAFSQAVAAAEAGDLTALHELHSLLAGCKFIFQYVREGGERDRWLAGQITPANGIRWFEPHYDRCAAIAKAEAFAQWPLTEGRLTMDYWRELAVQFDDPMFRSFAIADDVDDYAHAGNAERRELRARMSDNLRHVLRSGDFAAWSDLAVRLMDTRLTSDSAVGLAMMHIGCERGYDCTKDNRHNLVLRCDGSFDPNCGSAATMPEWYGRQESPETNARAQSLYERLNLLLNEEDWDGIEKLIPLDGTAFRQ